LSDSADHRIYGIDEILESANDGEMSFMEMIQKRQNSYAKGHKIVGYKTGFPVLDNLIGGLQKKHYTILAGYSGTGKTTFALTMMRNLLKQNIPLGFLSLEMTNSQVVEKLAIMESNICEKKLRDGNINVLEYQKLMEACEIMKTYPLYVDDRSGLAIELLGSKVAQMINYFQMKILFIDYIGEMTSIKKFNTSQELVATVSKGIRAVAKEYNIPILALCHLNRGSDIADRFPKKSDLRDSGQLEADATEILMLYRHNRDNQKFNNNLMTCFIRKNRFGNEGKIEYHFNPKGLKIEEYKE